jgi:plastocyanin
VRRKETNSLAVFSLIAGLLLSVPTNAFAEPGAPGQQAIVQLKGSGKIAGRVRVEGRVKKPSPLKVYKNRDFCGAEVPNESLLVGADGGLRNAVLILKEVRGIKGVIPGMNFVLDNKNCAFVPHVQVVPMGSEIFLLNGDPILHDVHARVGSETLFNVGLPSWRKVTKRLTRTGVVNIVCDVLHTWMSAYIVVAASPHFAVTNEKGEFVIEGIPPGAHKIEVWHEKLGSLSRKIEVMENQTSRVDLLFPCAAC